MASNPDFVQYIADQCAGAGEITVKKMFGDYGIYCDGVKDYFFIEDVDDRDYLSALVRETCKALPQPKPKKKK